MLIVPTVMWQGPRKDRDGCCLYQLSCGRDQGRPQTDASCTNCHVAGTKEGHRRMQLVPTVMWQGPRPQTDAACTNCHVAGTKATDRCCLYQLSCGRNQGRTQTDAACTNCHVAGTKATDGCCLYQLSSDRNQGQRWMLLAPAVMWQGPRPQTDAVCTNCHVAGTKATDGCCLYQLSCGRDQGHRQMLLAPAQAHQSSGQLRAVGFSFSCSTYLRSLAPISRVGDLGWFPAFPP